MSPQTAHLANPDSLCNLGGVAPSRHLCGTQTASRVPAHLFAENLALLLNGRWVHQRICSERNVAMRWTVFCV